MGTEGGRDDYFHHHTLPSLKVAKILLTERQSSHWNYELSHRAGIPRRVTLGILKRFKAMGWVSDSTERPTPMNGRSPRVLYLLTEVGAQVMGEALASLQMAST